MDINAHRHRSTVEAYEIPYFEYYGKQSLNKDVNFFDVLKEVSI